MLKEGAIKIVLLTFVTCGLYGIYWLIKTADELRERGAEIPPFWHVLIPILNIIWLWKWAQGVEKVSGGKVSGMTLLIVYVVFFPAAVFMVQGAFKD